MEIIHLVNIHVDLFSWVYATHENILTSRELCLSLHDSILKQVSFTKYLGVFIDQHLTWRNHIDYVLRRVRGKIYSINCLNPHSTVKNHCIK